MSEPTKRFSSRVSHYVKYRPSYPPAIVGLLAAECDLTSAARIADVGSGTGLLTELFLANGNPVCGIEPNDEMRAAGEQLLDAYPNFTSVAGTAEATTLPDHSADFISAGQAFTGSTSGARGLSGRVCLRPAAGWYWCGTSAVTHRHPF